MGNLKHFEAFLTVKSSSPSQSYRDAQEALINAQFSNSSSYYEIEEELTFGTLTYTDAGVRITDVITDKTTGEKLDSDFRRIIFKPNHSKGLGYRYKINDSTWLTVNSDDWSDSSIVRKCNHTLKWYDTTRKLIEEPCIVDYFNLSLSKNSLIENNGIVLPDKKCNIIIQKNDYTNALTYNQRFIFNKVAWQIVGFDFITYPNLVILNLEQILIDNATDDLVNEIPNENIVASTPTEGNMW